MEYSFESIVRKLLFYSDKLENIYYDHNLDNNLLLKNSINYYIGLIEISIYCLNVCSFKERDSYYEEVYYSDYLKRMFFNSSYKYFNINVFLNKYKLDYVVLVIFLIYPDYYIDAVYKSINYHDDKFINRILMKREEYINYIKNVINEIIKIKEYHNNDILCNILKLF